MPKYLLPAAAAFAFAALTGAGAAQTACLYGGPDPAADLACGRAFTASPAAPAAPVSNGVAQSRILSGGVSGGMRADGAAQPYLAAPPYAPAWPSLPDGYEQYPAPPPAFPQAPGGSAYSADIHDWPPDTFAYSYDSPAGGAFAWRYETPEGPAWAYAYETPEGSAWAWAYDSAPYAAPPPYPGPHPAPHHDPYAGPYRGPYADHAYGGAHHGGYHHDWRYAESRLHGASYPRIVWEAQHYYRESERVVAVTPLPGRIYLSPCCAGGVGYGYYSAPPVYYGYGGGAGFAGGFSGGGFAGGSFLTGGAMGAGTSSRAQASHSSAAFVSARSQAQAHASGNQNVAAGAPFAPPAWPGVGARTGW